MGTRPSSTLTPTGLHLPTAWPSAPKLLPCGEREGKGRQGMEGMKGMEAMGWDGDGMGWDGMGKDGKDGIGWDWLGGAGQGRAGRVLQRTPPASSCHNHPRKQQTTSQLGCPSHLSHAVTGFREPMRSDAAVVGSFRPISIRVAPATAVDRCSQCARGRGHAGSKTQQKRAKYLADPPSSLSPPPYSH
jgi:hypothetical protein